MGEHYDKLFGSSFYEGFEKIPADIKLLLSKAYQDFKSLILSRPEVTLSRAHLSFMTGYLEWNVCINKSDKIEFTEAKLLDYFSYVITKSVIEACETQNPSLVISLESAESIADTADFVFKGLGKANCVSSSVLLCKLRLLESDLSLIRSGSLSLRQKVLERISHVLNLDSTDLELKAVMPENRDVSELSTITSSPEMRKSTQTARRTIPANQSIGGSVSQGSLHSTTGKDPGATEPTQSGLLVRNLISSPPTTKQKTTAAQPKVIDLTELGNEDESVTIEVEMTTNEQNDDQQQQIMASQLSEVIASSLENSEPQNLGSLNRSQIASTRHEPKVTTPHKQLVVVGFPKPNFYTQQPSSLHSSYPSVPMAVSSQQNNSSSTQSSQIDILRSCKDQLSDSYLKERISNVIEEFRNPNKEPHITIPTSQFNEFIGLLKDVKSQLNDNSTKPDEYKESVTEISNIRTKVSNYLLQIDSYFSSLNDRLNRIDEQYEKSSNNLEDMNRFCQMVKEEVRKVTVSNTEFKNQWKSADFQLQLNDLSKGLVNNSNKLAELELKALNNFNEVATNPQIHANMNTEPQILLNKLSVLSSELVKQKSHISEAIDSISKNSANAQELKSYTDSSIVRLRDEHSTVIKSIIEELDTLNTVTGKMSTDLQKSHFSLVEYVDSRAKNLEKKLIDSVSELSNYYSTDSFQHMYVFGRKFEQLLEEHKNSISEDVAKSIDDISQRIPNTDHLATNTDLKKVVKKITDKMIDQDAKIKTVESKRPTVLEGVTSKRTLEDINSLKEKVDKMDRELLANTANKNNKINEIISTQEEFREALLKLTDVIKLFNSEHAIKFDELSESHDELVLQINQVSAVLSRLKHKFKSFKRNFKPPSVQNFESSAVLSDNDNSGFPTTSSPLFQASDSISNQSSTSQPPIKKHKPSDIRNLRAGSLPITSTHSTSNIQLKQEDSLNSSTSGTLNGIRLFKGLD